MKMKPHFALHSNKNTMQMHSSGGTCDAVSRAFAQFESALRSSLTGSAFWPCALCLCQPISNKFQRQLNVRLSAMAYCVYVCLCVGNGGKANKRRKKSTHARAVFYCALNSSMFGVTSRRARRLVDHFSHSSGVRLSKGVCCFCHKARLGSAACGRQILNKALCTRQLIECKTVPNQKRQEAGKATAFSANI